MEDIDSLREEFSVAVGQEDAFDVLCEAMDDSIWRSFKCKLRYLAEKHDISRLCELPQRDEFIILDEKDVESLLKNVDENLLDNIGYFSEADDKLKEGAKELFEGFTPKEKENLFMKYLPHVVNGYCIAPTQG